MPKGREVMDTTPAEYMNAVNTLANIHPGEELLAFAFVSIVREPAPGEGIEPLEQCRIVAMPTDPLSVCRILGQGIKTASTPSTFIAESIGGE